MRHSKCHVGQEGGSNTVSKPVDLISDIYCKNYQSTILNKNNGIHGGIKLLDLSLLKNSCTL